MGSKFSIENNTKQTYYLFVKNYNETGLKIGLIAGTIALSILSLGIGFALTIPIIVSHAIMVTVGEVIILGSFVGMSAGLISAIVGRDNFVGDLRRYIKENSDAELKPGEKYISSTYSLIWSCTVRMVSKRGLTMREGTCFTGGSPDAVREYVITEFGK